MDPPLFTAALVETGLLAHIEFLADQLKKLQNNDKKSTDHKPFSIDQIKQDDDHSVSFYRISILCYVFAILRVSWTCCWQTSLLRNQMGW